MHHRPTVLLVHDDIHARIRFGNWLSEAGYRCLTANDTASALRFAGRTSPDVAVIDISHPDRDRLWLAGRLRDRATPIGVVLMSGSPSSAHAEAAARLGVAELLVRPADAEELVEAVERAASWRDDEEARVLDVRETLMATVAARHNGLKRTVRSAGTAAEVMELVRATFRRGEPALLTHAERVSRMAGMLARALHLSPRAVADISHAALLHDLGKLALPEPVLLGEAPVGDSEMEALLDHHSRTLDLLNGRPEFGGFVTLIESVYECWDGKGYPVGLAARAVPFGARIVAVVDVYDAERSSCGSHDATAQHEAGAAALLREAGARVDPDLVRVFLHLLDG
jgi:putative two-component system response regulator